LSIPKVSESLQCTFRISRSFFVEILQITSLKLSEMMPLLTSRVWTVVGDLMVSIFYKKQKKDYIEACNWQHSNFYLPLYCSPYFLFYCETPKSPTNRRAATDLNNRRRNSKQKLQGHTDEQTILKMVSAAR
jgi:hypothetical protein